MNISEDLIRRIAERKFPGDPKKADAYIKNFNPADPACMEDAEALLAEDSKVDRELGEKRQQFRVEDYFIRKLIYDFYTGEVHAFLFPGADNNKEKADALAKGTPEEQKMAEWIRNGFSDRPIPLNSEKPLLYEQAVDKFSQKYGVHIDAANVAAAMEVIAKKQDTREESYRQYFKCLFASAYFRLDPAEQGRIDTFCKDFNKVMMVLLQEKTGTETVPAMKGKAFAYGGMTKQELKEYLTAFREKANDLTHKAEAARKNEKDPFGSAVKAVKDILKSGKTDEEKLSYGVAELQAAELRHANRPKHFWLSSPFENLREKRAIGRMKAMLSEFCGDKARIEEMEKRETTYHPSFSKEKECIEAFTASTETEYDFDRILTLDDLDLDKETDAPVFEGRNAVSGIEPAFPDGGLFSDEPAPSPVFDEVTEPLAPSIPEDEVPTLAARSEDD